jgi:hypothetical protein
VFGKYPSQQLGGGGGRYFTGSPADGYGCSVCHSGPEKFSFPVRVTGLPMNGYIPGTTSSIRLSWAEASAWSGATAAQRAALKPGVAAVLEPMTALTAEFVADDAEGAGSAGTLELPILVNDATERCVLRAGDTERELGTSIFDVARGVDPVELTDVGKEPCETGGEDEHRCIAAVKPCGSTEMQVRWTAPQRWRGPITFAVGFVAAGGKTGEPDDSDYVTELSIPIHAAVDDANEMTLASGCNVSGALSGPRAGSLFSFQGCAFWLGLSWLVLRRRPRALRVFGQRAAAIGSMSLLLSCTLCALCTSGCTDESPQFGQSNVPESVGLFEPGTRMDSGTAAPKCLDENIYMFADAGAEDGGGAKPPSYPGGKLVVSFTSTPPLGVALGAAPYDKNGTTPNYGAVWIEDPSGAYVKTLEHWKGGFSSLSLDYESRRFLCGEDVDIMAKATAQQHETHTSNWHSNTADGHVVPDGPYVLQIEVQIHEHLLRLPNVTVPFEKTRTPWQMSLPPSPPQSGLTLTYTPEK